MSMNLSKQTFKMQINKPLRKHASMWRCIFKNVSVPQRFVCTNSSVAVKRHTFNLSLTQADTRLAVQSLILYTTFDSQLTTEEIESRLSVAVGCYH